MKATTKTNLILDIILLVAFLVAFEPALTGMSIHEWLGITMGAMFLAHVALHWKWVVATTQRVFQPLALQTRLSMILNLALLVTFALVVTSGLMISKTLGVPEFLGISQTSQHVWRGIHEATPNLGLALIGLHLALHWRWIVTTCKRFLFNQTPQSAALSKKQNSGQYQKAL